MSKSRFNVPAVEITDQQRQEFQAIIEGNATREEVIQKAYDSLKAMGYPLDDYTDVLSQEREAERKGEGSSKIAGLIKEADQKIIAIEEKIKDVGIFIDPNKKKAWEKRISNLKELKKRNMPASLTPEELRLEAVRHFSEEVLLNKTPENEQKALGVALIQRGLLPFNSNYRHQHMGSVNILEQHGREIMQKILKIKPGERAFLNEVADILREAGHQQLIYVPEQVYQHLAQSIEKEKGHVNKQGNLNDTTQAGLPPKQVMDIYNEQQSYANMFVAQMFNGNNTEHLYTLEDLQANRKEYEAYKERIKRNPPKDGTALKSEAEFYVSELGKRVEDLKSAVFIGKAVHSSPPENVENLLKQSYRPLTRENSTKLSEQKPLTVEEILRVREELLRMDYPKQENSAAQAIAGVLIHGRQKPLGILAITKSDIAITSEQKKKVVAQWQKMMNSPKVQAQQAKAFEGKAFADVSVDVSSEYQVTLKSKSPLEGLSAEDTKMLQEAWDNPEKTKAEARERIDGKRAHNAAKAELDKIPEKELEELGQRWVDIAKDPEGEKQKIQDSARMGRLTKKLGPLSEKYLKQMEENKGKGKEK